MRPHLPTLLALLCTLPFWAFGQISDNFSDGDHTQNPSWQGDAALFKVSAGELQLNASGSGQALLATQGNIADSSIWNMRFRLSFSPSGQNLLRIYLLADRADLPNAQGYYLEAGETGSADPLRLFRQDGPAAKTLLATGQPALVATNPDIRLQAKRSTSGNWEIWAAPEGQPLQLQATATDATYGGGPDRFFGLQCVYTSTNATRFYFDDISIQPDIPDTQPPVLLSAIVNSPTQISLQFDEPLDSLSASTPARYTLSGSIGQPLTAQLVLGKTSVVLGLASPLTTGTYSVQASGLKDLAGNISPAQSLDFQYTQIEAAAEFDIVINEIMPDVNPVFGLPAVEWVELYNRSAKIIDLSTLRFADGAAAGLPLPAYLLYPGRFAVLATAANVPALRPFSADTVLAAAFSLNDGGDLLTLSIASGIVINKVDYRPDWHTDPDKDQGGWSLERINPQVPCLGKANWASCPLLPGGTPGKANASLDLSPDTQAPRLLEVFPESPSDIRLHFSEGLDAAAAADLSAYRISPARAWASASLYPDERGTVRLTLAEPLQVRTVYTLLVSAPIADCSGNELAGVDTVLIGLPERPAAGDVLVNELLFNPASGGARFVEFYNRSNKVIDWSDCFMADFLASPNPIAIAARRLCLPGTYTVFTPDPADILKRFAGAKPADVVEQSLPSWDEKAGNVTLQWSKDGQIVVLDSFQYSDEYHNALFSIGDREGVALERIRISSPTNDPANWTSAAVSRTLGPGSPTWPNSQRLEDLPSGGIRDLLQLSPARFSPDGDGFEDFLDIRYVLPREGYAATLTLFDGSGIPLRHFVRQQLIGTEGALRWDGDLDDGTLARPGIYVLLLEIFHPDGKVLSEKRAVTVVRRM